MMMNSTKLIPMPDDYRGKANTNKHKKYVNPPHRFVEKLPLHKNQQTIWNVYFSGKYRALVINAGRRFGKSTVCMAIAIELAVNYGKRVWWVGKLIGTLVNSGVMQSSY